MNKPRQLWLYIYGEGKRYNEACDLLESAQIGGLELVVLPRGSKDYPGEPFLMSASGDIFGLEKIKRFYENLKQSEYKSTS